MWIVYIARTESENSVGAALFPADSHASQDV